MAAPEALGQRTATYVGEGRPTANDKALDGDVILAAQAVLVSQASEEVVIATTNVRHLSRFAQASRWEEISPSPDSRQLA